MRSVLTLESRTLSTSSYGAGDVTWSTVDTLRGFIQGSGGNSKEVGEAVQDEATVTIRVRYDSRIKPLLRLTESETSRVFQIVEVNNDDDRDHEMILSCREIPI